LALVLAAGAPAAGQGEVVDLDGLKSTAPAAWKKEEPNEQARAMRRYQFRIPKEAGDPEDAELVIFFFGQGGGGDENSNIKRWQDMFKAPAGEKSKVDRFKAGAVDVTTVDVQGTYLFKFPPFAPNAKVTEKSDFRLIGVIFASPKGPYYMRLTGPAKTVEKHKKDFDAWLKNFK
jgi:hypothetical protein